ncbi:unnamed protein product [Paramecium pentaurelia]|uniref:Uncharacterized protein n=1 Tax=Paramecium pentaurelia TaxID=43138 RepID=A0A8S1YB05_9CILI|nr:unnamed protein product [Paramecium pentaurelia]
MSVLCLLQNCDDDFEIIDYKDNFRTCNIQIKNLANYKLWQKEIQYQQNYPIQQRFQFDTQPNNINIQIKGKKQDAELIILDNKIFLKNNDQNHIIYQLIERQIIQMEKVIRINQYSVNFDKQRKVLQFKNGLNEVSSIQLTQNRQTLMINGICFGVVYQDSNGEAQYQANSMQVSCKIQQNEQIELQNLQNFLLGTTQLYIEYQFN